MLVGSEVGVGTSDAVSGTGVGVAVGDTSVGISGGASVVWVAKMLAAISVALASGSAGEGPQATKMAPANRQTKTRNAFFSTFMTSAFQKVKQRGAYPFSGAPTPSQGRLTLKASSYAVIVTQNGQTDKF